MITCSWKDTSDVLRARYPSTVAFHAAHGDDLRKCDAWMCACGNTPDHQGFDPEPGPTDGDGVELFYLCDRCGRRYHADGREAS